MENKNIEKIAGDLLKKSLQQPESSRFDDVLMEKILKLPKPEIISSSRLLKKSWRFFTLSVVLLISTLLVVSYLMTGYYPEINQILSVTLIYILYGGMALFLPLIFTQLDSLLQIFFKVHHNPELNY